MKALSNDPVKTPAIARAARAAMCSAGRALRYSGRLARGFPRPA